MDSKMDNIYVFSACMNTNFSIIAIPIKSLKINFKNQLKAKLQSFKPCKKNIQT